MEGKVLFVLLVALTCVFCKPLDSSNPIDDSSNLPVHTLRKRFINPIFALGSSSDNTYRRLRTRRSAMDDCEKLQLCRLHARSGFLAAFQLYFVNKENARLWDHRSRNIDECNRRFSECYKR